MDKLGYVGYFKLKPGTDVKNLEKLSDQQAEQEKKAVESWGKYNARIKPPVYLTPISKMKLDAKSEGRKRR
jgi:putative ABC transport system permease protein